MATTFETDIIAAASGDIEISFIGHGTLMLRWKDVIIHVDPWTRLADYAKLPDADLILLTHHHRDHLDPEAIRHLRSDTTVLVLTELCAEKLAGGIVMVNGDSREVHGVRIDAVPAYNVQHRRDNGQPFHVPGEGNGYVLSFGATRIYVAGDTENTPEMKVLRDIDVAFLPMNLPYTMTPEMVADAALAFKPRILYPYHYGDTDPDRLKTLLTDHPEIEVRIRHLE